MSTWQKVCECAAARCSTARLRLASPFAIVMALREEGVVRVGSNPFFPSNQNTDSASTYEGSKVQPELVARPAT